MIKTRSDLKLYLNEDFKQYFTSKMRYLKSLMIGTQDAKAYRYLKCLRYCEYYDNKVGFIDRILSHIFEIKKLWLGSKYHISIPNHCCGYGLKLFHLEGGVIINANRVGNYCGFNSGVVLGNRHSKEDRPYVGDNVIFCPGSMAFGSVHIGDRAYICPNAVVTKDVAVGAIMAGIPAKDIRKSQD